MQHLTFILPFFLLFIILFVQASSFIIAGCTLLVFMYFFLLCTHLMFLNAASGKGHPAMRIIRQLYHVLSIFKALSLVIADSMVIYISSGRGNIHRLVLNEGSSFMILEIVYVISTIILAVLIPSGRKLYIKL